MISPAMDFTKDSVAKISFDYVIRYCESGKESEYHSLLISNDYAGDVETATWESIDFEAAANTTSWDVTRINEMVLPEKYMGDHNVTIAFYYKGTSTKAGTFEIDNVVLQAIEGYNNGDDSTTGDEDGDGDDGGDEGGNTGGTEGNNGNFTDGSFTLVTDAARLTVGDSILIAYGDFVMGTDAGNFRNKTDMMTSNGKVTYLAADAQKILLEAGVVEGTFAFNVGDGYLAAKSSSSNHITTATEIDANGSWTITIGNEALAVIEAQGDKTRNTLQYNTSSPRFSCYTGTQKSVNIYAKSPVATGIDSKKTDEESFDVYSLTGNILRSNVTRSEATNGLQLGIYIVNGKKVLVE